VEHVPGYPSVDLGPAWFWPHNRHVVAAVQDLGLGSFTQEASGATVIDRGPGAPSQRAMLPDAEGSPFRIVGGVTALVQALARDLNPGAIRLGTAATRIEQTEAGVRVHTDSDTVGARVCILALPPEVIARGLAFSPPLAEELTRLMHATPTWMSWSMKAALVYPRATWREAGLSGAAISQSGPVQQFYDATEPGAFTPGASGGPAALVGWVDPAQSRRFSPEALREAVVAQASRLFGMGEPLAFAARDWSAEPLTSPPTGLPPGATTQFFGHHTLRDPLWNGLLHLAGSETSGETPGYLDGALARGAEVARSAAERLAE